MLARSVSCPIQVLGEKCCGEAFRFIELCASKSVVTLISVLQLSNLTCCSGLGRAARLLELRSPMTRCEEPICISNQYPRGNNDSKKMTGEDLGCILKGPDLMWRNLLLQA
jgi:hypothetical protein